MTRECTIVGKVQSVLTMKQVDYSNSLRVQKLGTVIRRATGHICHETRKCGTSRRYSEAADSNNAYERKFIRKVGVAVLYKVNFTNSCILS
jgi:hypothetical protein